MMSRTSSFRKALYTQARETVATVRTELIRVRVRPVAMVAIKETPHHSTPCSARAPSVPLAAQLAATAVKWRLGGDGAADGGVAAVDGAPGGGCHRE